jgi:alkylated DNA repair dioxygenase AlkB
MGKALAFASDRCHISARLVMAQTPHAQLSLFGGGLPALGSLADVRRIELDDTAWLEYLPNWVSGQDTLMATLITTTRWREEQRRMYDRLVTVPRLVASLPQDGVGDPLLLQIQQALSAQHGVLFPRVSMAYYRSGADSVAWHGDTTARDLPEALVATVSLGGPRRFLLRPRSGGRSIALSLGLGDLLVMGGSCQRTWQHSIPKVAHSSPRLALMYRPIWIAPKSIAVT